MDIRATAEELISVGVWDEVCDLKGFSVWCVAEGTMDCDDLISFTLEEAKKIGLV